MCPGLCFLRLQAGLGGAEVSLAARRPEPPFLPGRLCLPLRLPQSAPTTKVARQVPGLSQRARSSSVPLPGAESQGTETPYTQNVSLEQRLLEIQSFCQHRMILVASGRCVFEGRNTQPRCVSPENVALSRFHLTLLGKRKLKTWTPEHPFGIADRGTHGEKVPQICHQLITYKSQGRRGATSIQLVVL